MNNNNVTHTIVKSILVSSRSISEVDQVSPVVNSWNSHTNQSVVVQFSCCLSGYGFWDQYCLRLLKLSNDKASCDTLETNNFIAAQTFVGSGCSSNPQKLILQAMGGLQLSFLKKVKVVDFLPWQFSFSLRVHLNRVSDWRCHCRAILWLRCFSFTISLSTVLILKLWWAHFCIAQVTCEFCAIVRQVWSCVEYDDTIPLNLLSSWTAMLYEMVLSVLSRLLQLVWLSEYLQQGFNVRCGCPVQRLGNNRDER